ncbi:hypothetical protein PInf_017046 [Phytophthora infestans]|nr:hypothetical protein PInf_017046 [Phytophthora infestans]
MTLVGVAIVATTEAMEAAFETVEEAEVKAVETNMTLVGVAIVATTEAMEAAFETVEEAEVKAVEEERKM